jgi:3-phosphoshikimate 1-carboxyvinyltransferase
MNYSIYHPNSIVNGEINLPSSKSLSNRALIIQHLYSTSFKINNISEAHDTTILKNALKLKGGEINIQDAGTAFRFLTSYLSITKGEFILTGSERIKQRPIGDLVDALRTLGAKIEYLEKENRAPLKIIGSKIDGGNVRIKGSSSSQFISSLLMIAPRLKNGLKLTIEDIMVSKPYIEMTLKMLNYFGIKHKWSDNSIEIEYQEIKPKDITIESDWSSVGFWLEIISICKQGKIKLKGLFKNSWQGDKLSPNYFKSLNVHSKLEENSLVIKKKESKSSIDSTVNLLELPDLSLSLICSYAFNNKTATFNGLQTLKDKESDRLKSLSKELKKYGIESSYNNSSLTIINCNNKKTSLEFSTYKDHRIAMSLAPLALKEKIVVNDIDVVKKSYPNFWKDLKSVGFIINEEADSDN